MRQLGSSSLAKLSKKEIVYTPPLPETFDWGEEAKLSYRRLQSRAIKVDRSHYDHGIDAKAVIEKVKKETSQNLSLFLR